MPLQLSNPRQLGQSREVRRRIRPSAIVRPVILVAAEAIELRQRLPLILLDPSSPSVFCVEAGVRVENLNHEILDNVREPFLELCAAEAWTFGPGALRGEAILERTCETGLRLLCWMCHQDGFSPRPAELVPPRPCLRHSSASRFCVRRDPCS